MNKQQCVQNVKEELWKVLQQQKISKLINQRKKHYQLLWNNDLIMNMSISLKDIHISSAKLQESTLKKKSFQKLKYL